MGRWGGGAWGFPGRRDRARRTRRARREVGCCPRAGDARRRAHRRGQAGHARDRPDACRFGQRSPRSSCCGCRAASTGFPRASAHAVIDGWTEGEDTTVIVMRDLGDAVLDVGRPARRTYVPLGAGARRRPAPRLPRRPARRGRAAAAGARAVRARRASPTWPRDGDELFAAALRGWDYFADPALVPPDVSEPVFALHADVRPLADGLAAGPVTLAHGDLATVNMAIEDDRLVLLDWAMPVAAPGAIDIARLLVGLRPRGRRPPGRGDRALPARGRPGVRRPLDAARPALRAVLAGLEQGPRHRGEPRRGRARAGAHEPRLVDRAGTEGSRRRSM